LDAEFIDQVYSHGIRNVARKSEHFGLGTDILKDTSAATEILIETPNLTKGFAISSTATTASDSVLG
jgi:hypothetical protein